MQVNERGRAIIEQCDYWQRGQIRFLDAVGFDVGFTCWGDRSLPRAALSPNSCTSKRAGR